jgi:arylsulfatase
VHAPQHAPKAWIDRFRGQFDQGWDIVRQQTFERQKALGVVPPDAILTPRPAALPAWSTLGPDQRRLYARYMEACAAQLAYFDHQIGRVIERLRASGQLENTLVIFIEGDNGASAEGGVAGEMYEQSLLTGSAMPSGWALDHIDEIGGPRAYNLYPAGWAWATSGPFPWYKQVASHFGGTRNGLVISWPARIKDRGGLRSQFHYITDVMPTILAAAEIDAPATLDGVAQQPIDGISMRYSFDRPDAPSRRRTQIFEMVENAAIYHDGWMASTQPYRPAWDFAAPKPPFDQRRWSLYNIDEDFSQARDLAAVRPGKLAELQKLFWKEASANNILPIHTSEGAAGMPGPATGRTRFVFFPGMTREYQRTVPSTIGTSYRFDADVDLSAGGAHGVLVTQGGRFGGYAFYIDDAGYLVYHYNALGPYQYKIRSTAPVKADATKVSVSFESDRPKPGSGGTATLFVDGSPVGRGRIERTLAGWISHTDGFDVGEDSLTPINDDYDIGTSRFTGTMTRLTMTLGS